MSRERTTFPPANAVRPSLPLCTLISTKSAHCRILLMIFFETIPELLKKGLEAGEPAMMFLAAEFSHYAAFSKTYRVSYDRGVDPAKTYLRASQAGSVHATLWCAFCYDTEPEKFPEYQSALETARRSVGTALSLCNPGGGKRGAVPQPEGTSVERKNPPAAGNRCGRGDSLYRRPSLVNRSRKMGLRWQ